MTTARRLPGATLVLERNGRVFRARVDALFDGQSYQFTLREDDFPEKGNFHGILHWRFEEGILTQALQVSIRRHNAVGTPIEPVRKFQRRREPRFPGSFDVRLLALQYGKTTIWKGSSLDISLHGLCVQVESADTAISPGMFLEVNMALPSGTVDGFARVVYVVGKPPRPLIVRLRISGLNEQGFHIIYDWIHQQKKEESR
ncbi:MAG: PilZ domain-containing protein [bacterium JZ-2024 1]